LCSALGRHNRMGTSHTLRCPPWGGAVPRVHLPHLVLICFCAGLDLGSKLGQSPVFFLSHSSLLLLGSLLQLLLQGAEKARQGRFIKGITEVSPGLFRRPTSKSPAAYMKHPQTKKSLLCLWVHVFSLLAHQGGRKLYLPFATANNCRLLGPRLLCLQALLCTGFTQGRLQPLQPESGSTFLHSPPSILF
jgi:hypothetical protein